MIINWCTAFYVTREEKKLLPYENYLDNDTEIRNYAIFLQDKGLLLSNRNYNFDEVPVCAAKTCITKLINHVKK